MKERGLRMKLRIMTYNIHSGRDAWGRLDLAAIGEFIRTLNPDILALNEVRMGTSDVNGDEQARTLAAQLGMHWTFAPAIPYLGGQYGIAVLSRFPIVRTDFWPVKPVPVEQRETYYEDRVLLRALVDAGRPVAVYTSHYGLSNAERVNAVDLTLKHLKDETIPTVFMGDLNMEPDDPLIARLKTEMTDSAEGRSFLTFSADKPEIRIDYLFLRGPFRVLNAFAPTSTASDHLPHVTDVEL